MLIDFGDNLFLYGKIISFPIFSNISECLISTNVHIADIIFPLSTDLVISSSLAGNLLICFGHCYFYTIINISQSSLEENVLVITLLYLFFGLYSFHPITCPIKIA